MPIWPSNAKATRPARELSRTGRISYWTKPIGWAEFYQPSSCYAIDFKDCLERVPAFESSDELMYTLGGLVDRVVSICYSGLEL